MLKSDHISALLLLLAPSSFLYLFYLSQRQRRHPLPPSLKGWPLIGNALDIPLQNAGPIYATWAKKLGSNILSANALGTNLIIVNSIEIAEDLLEKRAVKYSDRPVSTLVNELMGWDWLFVFLPYSEPWKECRRLFVQHFRPGDDPSRPNTNASQTTEFVNRFLVDLRRTPEEFYGLAKHMVGSLAISLAYGIPTRGRDDPLIQFVDSVARMLTRLLTPGGNVVDLFPLLKYLPSWLPGAGFKRYAESVRYMPDKYRSEPYDQAVKSFGKSNVRPSFLSAALAALEREDSQPNSAAVSTRSDRAQRLKYIKDTAATVYGTATDTTASSIQTLIFALATHPHVREVVQAELDAVVFEKMPGAGHTLRLPTFEDREKLPYLMATVMESLRWAPIAPIGVPRQTAQDDVYDGYFIPRGSVVIVNAWSMLHDEAEYGPDTKVFNPERFLRMEKNTDNLEDKYELNSTIRQTPQRFCLDLEEAASLLTLFDFEPSENLESVTDLIGEKFDAGFMWLRSPEAAALLADLELALQPEGVEDGSMGSDTDL
ncbi:cytochrome P450 [Ephemerocybe angulata]|uniref:Cytochrome P450 n=1 Tax=Ephemerocybe angulata TaxID=980116 RepID=A0A8H6M6R4_9AGAR|nr:cytochrome P450 [Tulosesus angulatus]